MESDDYQKFRESAMRQVTLGFSRRDNVEIKAVFGKCAKDGERMAKDELPRALEMLGVNLPSDADSLEAFFLEIDLNKNGLIEFEEFLLAVNRQSSVASWSRGVPWWQIVADSIPKQYSEDSLRRVSNLSDLQLEAVCDAISFGMKRELMAQIKSLNQSFAEMDRKAGTQSNSDKFKCFKASCGTVTDFHQGLGGRVGESRKVAKGLENLSESFLHDTVDECGKQVFRTSSYFLQWMLNTAKSRDMIILSQLEIISSRQLQKPNGT
jgi:hypothetical protein